MSQIKKILIIEDNDENMYLSRFILEKNGYRVAEARTGEEGFETAIREKFDLILMDVQLPGLDGLEVTRMIRASDIDGKVPIVALTSFAMTGDREKALQAGCTGYIEKPINPDTFMIELRKFL